MYIFQTFFLLFLLTDWRDNKKLIKDYNLKVQ